MQPLRQRRPRTAPQRTAARRVRMMRGQLANDVRRYREDAGLSLSALADVAGISKSHLHAIEAGSKEARFEPLARVAAALGLDLSVRLYPGTGPLIRDHLQAAMAEALLGIIHERWRPSLEVWVRRPVRGVIDLVLDAQDSAEPRIATEAHSELRRLEQQVRWSGAKANALAEASQRRTSRLLLLRNSRHVRAVVAAHAEVIRAAYPARAADAFASLTGERAWPGDAILWADVDDGHARIRPTPPRGITSGR